MFKPQMAWKAITKNHKQQTNKAAGAAPHHSLSSLDVDFRVFTDLPITFKAATRCISLAVNTQYFANTLKKKDYDFRWFLAYKSTLKRNLQAQF